jgi:cbb3-type cytochrome oxidase maturation protein
VSIIFVLIPLGLVLVGCAAWAFFWAVNDGQFDDLDTPAIAILTEDERGPGAAGAQQPTGGGHSRRGRDAASGE